MEYVIGVDSGGTHVTGLALSLSGEILAERKAGIGNVFSDEEHAVRNLEKVVGGLLSEFRADECQYILLGIAGVETAGNAERLEKKFAKEFDQKVVIISDAKLALLNGLKGEDGTLVISGTGSVIYGRQDHNFSRYGGWGPMVGDTGSAYKIAERAMKHCLKQYDEGEPSLLMYPLLRLLASDTLPQAVKTYNSLDRAAISGLAEDIAKQAIDGNQEAKTVLKIEATALADEVWGLMKQYQRPMPTSLALSGSVLVHNVIFRETLVKELRKHLPELKPIVVTSNNAIGAIYWPRWQ